MSDPHKKPDVKVCGALAFRAHMCVLLRSREGSNYRTFVIHLRCCVRMFLIGTCLAFFLTFIEARNKTPEGKNTLP